MRFVSAALLWLLLVVGGVFIFFYFEMFLPVECFFFSLSVLFFSRLFFVWFLFSFLFL